MTFPADSMDPIVRQMLDAEDDGGRAKVLLAVPDLHLAKYAWAFSKACRRARFDEGEEFILVRMAAMRAVRDGMGNLRPELTLQLKDARTAMVRVLAGEGEGGKPAPRQSLGTASGAVARPSAASGEGAASEGQDQ